MTLRVGVTSRHHGTWPSIRVAPIPGVNFVDSFLYPVGTRIANRSQSLRDLAKAVGVVRGAAECNLFHSYQQVLLNRKPWGVSYDALMPFYPKPYLSKGLYDALFSVLARDECRFVLPHSRNALNQLVIRNGSHRLLDQVLRRVRVVYPAVSDLGAPRDRDLGRDLSEGVRFLFVGTQFFIKGGHLAAEVVAALKAQYPVSLTVVSTLSTVDWTTKRDPDLAPAWKAKLKALGVRHYEQLPNSKVRDIMAESDVLLLPSIDETFGFVLLEALASGLAIVATGIRAVPEIVVHGETGFVLPCDVDDEGRMIRNGRHEDHVRVQLDAAIRKLLDNLPLLRAMKMASRKRYLERFSIQRLATDLAAVYSAVAI